MTSAYRPKNDSDDKLLEQTKKLYEARKEIRRLKQVLTQCLSQACNLLDGSPDASTRIASMSLRGFIPKQRKS